MIGMVHKALRATQVGLTPQNINFLTILEHRISDNPRLSSLQAGKHCPGLVEHGQLGNAFDELWFGENFTPLEKPEEIHRNHEGNHKNAHRVECEG